MYRIRMSFPVGFFPSSVFVKEWGFTIDPDEARFPYKVAADVMEALRKFPGEVWSLEEVSGEP